MTSRTDTVEFRFEARRSVIEPCLRWRLSGDSLLCERGPQPNAWLSRLLRPLMPRSRPWPERVPLGEITAIRLRFDPTRFDTNRYRCDLRERGGARISIFSTHYLGPGNFEDRGEPYAAFVGELVLRAQRLAPSLAVAGGLSWPSYLIQHGLLLASLLALVTMLGIAGMPLFGPIWVKLAILAAYAGLAWRYARVNFPTTLSLPPRPEAGEAAPESRAETRSRPEG